MDKHPRFGNPSSSGMTSWFVVAIVMSLFADVLTDGNVTSEISTQRSTQVNIINENVTNAILEEHTTDSSFNGSDSALNNSIAGQSPVPRHSITTIPSTEVWSTEAREGVWDGESTDESDSGSLTTEADELTSSALLEHRNNLNELNKTSARQSPIPSQQTAMPSTPSEVWSTEAREDDASTSDTSVDGSDSSTFKAGADELTSSALLVQKENQDGKETTVVNDVVNTAPVTEIGMTDSNSEDETRVGDFATEDSAKKMGASRATEDVETATDVVIVTTEEDDGLIDYVKFIKSNSTNEVMLPVIITEHDDDAQSTTLSSKSSTISPAAIPKFDDEEMLMDSPQIPNEETNDETKSVLIITDEKGENPSLASSIKTEFASSKTESISTTESSRVLNEADDKSTARVMNNEDKSNDDDKMIIQLTTDIERGNVTTAKTSTSSDLLAAESEDRPFTVEPEKILELVNDSVIGIDSPIAAAKQAKATENADRASEKNSRKPPSEDIISLQTLSSENPFNDSLFATPDHSEKDIALQTTLLPQEKLEDDGNATNTTDSEGTSLPSETSSASNNSQQTIAGVGVKTTVSVSLHVSKMENNSMGNSGDQETKPTKDSDGLNKGNSIELSSDISHSPTDTAANDSAIPLRAEKAINGVTKDLPSSQVIITGVIENVTSPAPPSTTKRYGIRKPQLRTSPGSEPITPRTARTTTTRPPLTRSTAAITLRSYKSKTRAPSITSSTTMSTTEGFSFSPRKIGSRRPYVPSYNSAFSFGPESVTIPTTTEEEEEEEEEPEEEEGTTEDNASGDNNNSTTTPDDNVTLIKIPASIVIKKGLRWAEQLRNRHSPEYRNRARKVQTMLENLFRETYVGPRLWKLEIESFSMKTPREKSVMVDYYLYLVKTEQPIHHSQLVQILNNKLVNDTYSRYTLDPAFTEFDIGNEERMHKPTAAPDVQPPIPQWAIAVIVIGAASLIFIILFGAVTVYGRHHMRRKYTSKLSDEDMERAIESKEWENKLGAAYENLAADGIYDGDDVSVEKMNRRHSLNDAQKSTKLKRYDSWKSEWTEPPKRVRLSVDRMIF